MPTYEDRQRSILNRNMQWADPAWKITTFKSDKEEEEFDAGGGGGGGSTAGRTVRSCCR